MTHTSVSARIATLEAELAQKAAELDAANDELATLKENRAQTAERIVATHPEYHGRLWWHIVEDVLIKRDTALADLASAREECERLRGELARRPRVDPDEDEPVEPTWEEEATPEEINAQQMLDHGLTYFDKP